MLGPVLFTLYAPFSVFKAKESLEKLNASKTEFPIDDIMSLTQGMNGVILPIVSLGIIRPEDSGAVRNASIKLHSETRVSGCLGMSGGRSPRHAQNPLSGEPRKKPYHHNPYIIICTSFISSIDYNVFIVLQCHLKDHLCRTTTTSLYY